MARERLDPWLVRASLAYLALPVLLFLALWLRPAFAIPAVLVTLAGVIVLLRGTGVPPVGIPSVPLGSGKPGQDAPDTHGRDARATVVACLVVALVATVFSGAGGVGLQNWDYDKHNAVLHDLITRPLPVRYADAGDPALAGPLVYYMGWYMPAAVVGRAFGWTAANVALFLWTFAGLALALLWFSRLAKGTGWWPPLFLLFFSGMDVVGAAFQGRNPLGMSNLSLHHWAGFAQYTHNLALVNWVPHHALAMWIGTALVLHGVLERGRREGLVGPWALLPFWSPWAMVGVFPLVAIGMFRGKGRIASLGSLAVFLGSMPFVMAYLASNRGDVMKGWAWTFTGGLPFLGMISGFLILEFALVAALVWRILRPEGTERWLLATAIAGLALLPLYRFGISGDLTMRASLPLLFVLAIFAFRALKVGQGRERIALGVLLAIGALSPLHEFVYSAAHYRLGVPDAATIRPLPLTDGRGYAKQFVGSEEKPFWRVMAK
ncbi:MAG: hypothetical protein ACO1SV_20810 [Fimbriimonas sp.]